MATLNSTPYFTTAEVQERLGYKDAANVRQLVLRLRAEGITVGTKFGPVWAFSEVDVLHMERFLHEHGRTRGDVS